GGAAAVVAGGDRLLQGGDAAGDDARPAALPAGVADGGDGVADLHPGRGGERGGLEPGRALQPDDRDVARPVVADDPRGVGAAVVGVGALDLRGAADHVVVGQHEAGGGEHDARPGGAGVAQVLLGLDVDDAGAAAAGLGGLLLGGRGD